MRTEIILFIKTIKAMREVLIVSPLGEKSINKHCKDVENKPILYVNDEAIRAIHHVTNIRVISPPDDFWKQSLPPTEINQEFLNSILKEFKDSYYVIVVAIHKDRINLFLDCVNNFNQHNGKELNLIPCNFEKDGKKVQKKNIFLLEKEGEDNFSLSAYFEDDSEDFIQEEVLLEEEYEEVSEADFIEAAISHNYEKFNLPKLNWILRKFSLDESYEWIPEVKEAIKKKKNK